MASVKSYSIIIVPSDHSGTRQYRISRTMLFVLAGLAAILVVTLAIFAFTYGSLLMDARRVSELETENEALRIQVARVDDLSRELESMSGLRAQVLSLLGTDELSDVPALETIGETVEFERRALVDVERLQQLFADASRAPFAPRAWPAEGTVRREFIAQATADEAAHPGIAIDVGDDPQVRAAGRGRVLEASFAESTGHVVVIDHGYGFRSTYANLDRVEVRVGQAVDRGQAIGEIDRDRESSGGRDRTSTMLRGALYFELRVDGSPVDPRTHLEPR